MGRPSTPALSFDLLVSAIGQVDAELSAQAGRAVNMSLTLRNWLIGFHIAEYEQGGADRAQYGERLLERLSDRLLEAGVSRAEERELRRYRQIREALTPELSKRVDNEIFVSKYLLELPKKEAIQHFIETQLVVEAHRETTIRHTTGGESRIDKEDR